MKEETFLVSNIHHRAGRMLRLAHDFLVEGGHLFVAVRACCHLSALESDLTIAPASPTVSSQLPISRL